MPGFKENGRRDRGVCYIRAVKGRRAVLGAGGPDSEARARWRVCASRAPAAARSGSHGATVPAVGGGLIVPVSSRALHGLFAVVTGVQRRNVGSTVLRTRPAALSEVYS
jgi:hypothetical protein